jgi:N-acetylneuraminate synthase
MREPVLIAEIGCNHMGDLDTAKRLIEVAKNFCEVDHVKFQKRENRLLLPPEQYTAPHPVPANSFGDTYGEHREFLEFDIEQHKQLKAYCEEWGADYSCSIWDMTSTQEIAELRPALIKVPSACNTNYEMAGCLCESYPGEIHVSLGMTTSDEIDELVDFYKSKGRNNDLVLYHCTSGYPVPFQDTCLLEISRLKDRYHRDVKGIGFSGHHLGIAIDVAAYALGANYFERHFTLDRTWKGTDHAASLEPDGMRRLWRDLKATERALQHKPKEILDIEVPQKQKLKWNRHE